MGSATSNDAIILYLISKNENKNTILAMILNSETTYTQKYMDTLACTYIFIVATTLVII